MQGNTLSLEELNGIFLRNVLTYEDKCSISCREISLEAAKVLREWKSELRGFSVKVTLTVEGKKTCQMKLSYAIKLSATAVFNDTVKLSPLYSRPSITTVVTGAHVLLRSVQHPFLGTRLLMRWLNVGQTRLQKTISTCITEITQSIDCKILALDSVF